MNNLNSVLLEGNLVRDPVLRTAGESSVCTFTIAVNRRYRNMSGEYVEETLFIDIDCWGKKGENCAKYLLKGRSVRVVGRLKQDVWVGDDGKNRYKIFVVAEHVEFRGGVKKSSSDEDDFTDL